MKNRNIWLAVCLALALVPAAASIAAASEKDEMKARHKMEDVDLTAKNTLDQLLKESETAKELFDKAYGYAVFDNLKLAFGISGGGGSGVAVERATGKRTYMNMGTGGIGFGIGGQKYQVVFLFEAQKPFEDFVENGWKADAAANAAAGSEGVSLQTGFVNGLAVYQITDKGLMLNADISGSKYWKDKNLNKYATEKASDAKTE
ncbi:MAG: hypothetical protein H6Q78_536 [Candidatus Krumholzibacteriota bacterium]|nr:hypothetical protein [Candidatus Krumholzibacteriota bacterium]